MQEEGQTSKQPTVAVLLQHIVIKPGLGVDPAKEPGPGFHGSTWVNSGQPEKLKKLKF